MSDTHLPLPTLRCHENTSFQNSSPSILCKIQTDLFCSSVKPFSKSQKQESDNACLYLLQQSVLKHENIFVFVRYVRDKIRGNNVPVSHCVRLVRGLRQPWLLHLHRHRYGSTYAGYHLHTDRYIQETTESVRFNQFYRSY